MILHFIWTVLYIQQVPLHIVKPYRPCFLQPSVYKAGSHGASRNVFTLQWFPTKTLGIPFLASLWLDLSQNGGRRKSGQQLLHFCTRSTLLSRAVPHWLGLALCQHGPLCRAGADCILTISAGRIKNLLYIHIMWGKCTGVGLKFPVVEHNFWPTQYRPCIWTATCTACNRVIFPLAFYNRYYNMLFKWSEYPKLDFIESIAISNNFMGHS